MARNARITVEDRAQAMDAQGEFLEYNADLNYDADTEEALHKLKDSFAGTDTKGTMWVYRLPLDTEGEVIGNAKPTMLFNASIDRYELEELSTKLRKEYMKPGERAVFRITATMRGQQGMKLNRLLILQRENVEEMPEPSARESFAELFKIVQESNQQAADRTERLLTAIAARESTRPAIDPVQMSMQMLAAMTGLTQSLVARPVAPATDPMQTLTMTLGALKQMKGFFGDGGGEDGDPDSLASVLRAAQPIASTIGELLKRSGPAVAALPNPHLRRRRVAVTSPAVVTDPAIQEVRQMLAQIIPQLKAMSESAAGGADPKAVASMVLQAFEPDSPEETKFMGFLEREDWWQLLSGVYPPAVPHQPWFTALREAILAEFDSDEPAAGA